MKKLYNISFFAGLIAAFILFTGYGQGPATVIGLSNTGAPGENGLMCANCHGFPGAYGGVNTTVEVFEIGTNTPPVGNNYTSGTTYDVQVTVNYNVNTPIGFGFQCVAVDAQGAQVGAFSNPQSNAKIVTLATGVQVAEHNGISVAGQADVFKFQWTAPNFLLGSVDVTFYSSGAAVNSNSANSGDAGSAVSGTYTMTPTAFPVELIEFKAKNIDNQYHLLEWSTASELDASHFIVEHATDGESFTSITQLNAAGTTSEQQDYEFRFMQPQTGTNYYRLTQVDLDGTTNILKTVTVYHFEGLELVKVYPVPAYSNVSIGVRYSETDDFELSVVDLSGKTLIQKQVTMHLGFNTIDLDLAELPAGSFVLKLSNKKALITSPLLKF